MTARTKRRRVVISPRVRHMKPIEGGEVVTVFAQPDEIERAGTLIEAYDLVRDPKPSLQTVMTDLLRRNVFQAAINEHGIMCVPSLRVFVETIEAWMDDNAWSEGGIWRPLPTGYVAVIEHCRQKISPQQGGQAGLFSMDNKRATLSGKAQSYLKAGDLQGVQKSAGRGAGVWAARPSDIDAWLWRRWKLGA